MWAQQVSRGPHSVTLRDEKGRRGPQLEKGANGWKKENSAGKAISRRPGLHLLFFL
jgi:hypothetical protein